VKGDLESRLPFRVWRVDTDGAPDPSDLAVVDSAERDRGRRFVRESDRNAFLKTRAALRRLLGRLAGAEPQTIKFEENAWGKPLLAGKSASAISFSVSHTDGLSVIAVSDGRKIGIDVERDRCVADRDRIATNVFGASMARALSCLQDAVQDGAFLRLWTAAEAFVKATGTGFAGLDAQIPVSLSGSSGVVGLKSRRAAAGEPPLSLLELALPRGFLGSIVIEGVAGSECAIVPELVRSPAY
jgi:4'-phosphopantetheinyl transferase